MNLLDSLGIRTDYHELPQDDSPRGKIGFKAQCSSSQIWLNNVEHNRILEYTSQIQPICESIKDNDDNYDNVNPGLITPVYGWFNWEATKKSEKHQSSQ